MRASSLWLTIFVVLVLIAGGWAILASYRAHRQSAAVALVRSQGGFLFFDHELVRRVPVTESVIFSELSDSSRPPPGPAWLRRRLGDEPFRTLLGVGLQGKTVSAADLQVVSRLAGLYTSIFRKARCRMSCWFAWAT